MAESRKELHRVDGFKVVYLETGADEEKDAEWLARKEKEFPREEFEREFLLKPVGYADSYSTFPDYERLRHENPNLVYQQHLRS